MSKKQYIPSGYQIINITIPSEPGDLYLLDKDLNIPDNIKDVLGDDGVVLAEYVKEIFITKKVRKPLLLTVYVEDFTGCVSGFPIITWDVEPTSAFSFALNNNLQGISVIFEWETDNGVRITFSEN